MRTVLLIQLARFPLNLGRHRPVWMRHCVHAARIWSLCPRWDIYPFAQASFLSYLHGVGTSSLSAACARAVTESSSPKWSRRE